jgi:hypothetical protein
MNTPRAFSGEYSDLKFIKTRSVVQMHVEFPIEDGAEIVKLFGAPLPGKPVRVAIARLNLKPELEVVPNNNPISGSDTKRAGEEKHRDWSSLSPAQQAGICSGEPRFWKFLNEQSGDQNNAGVGLINSAETAATYIRLVCGVQSRRELHTADGSLGRWIDLDARYRAWQLAPSVGAM